MSRRLPAAAKLPSKRWRNLILRVWHVDPLRCCPVCQNPMRVIAVIVMFGWPRKFSAISRHGTPHRLDAPDGSGPYTYKPCDDIAPADYENALTD